MRGLCVLALMVGVAHAQNPDPAVWIAPPVTFAAPDLGPFAAVAVGDVDNDGRADVVHVSEARGLVRAALNRGRGGAWETELIADLFRPDAIALLDIDDDGDLDAAFRDPGDDVVVIATQTAPGDWDVALLPLVEHGDHAYSVGDVNGDGRADLSLNDPLHHVVLQDGDAPRMVRLVEAAPFDGPVHFADFDGDGDADAVARRGEVPILLRNDGALPWVEIALASRALSEAPLGFADISPAGAGAELVGSGDGRLQIAPNAAPRARFGPWLATDESPLADIRAVDADGDGDLDLFGPARDRPLTVVYLENDGAGGFVEQRRVNGSGGAAPFHGRAFPGDFDGDGRVDVAIDYGRDQLYLYANGRGVISASWVPNRESTVEGGARVAHGAVVLDSLVPLPQPVDVRALEVQLEVDAPRAVVDTVSVYREADGDNRLSEGDALLGEAQGDDVGARTQVVLGDGVPMGSGASVRLHVVSTLRVDAHLHAPALTVGWSALTAAFADGSPAAIAQQLFWPCTWTLRNRAPTARPDAFEVDEGSAVVLDVLVNDTDPLGDPLVVEIITPPEFAEAEPVEGGVRYTHDGSEGAADRFTYRVLDPAGAASAEVEVSLTVRPTNDAPVGRPDAYLTVEDVPLLVEADLGVLLNDDDIEGDLLNAVVDTPPPVGELQLADDGSFLYLPARDMNGEVRFTYRPDDGEALGEPVTVTLTILPDEDPPRPNLAPVETPTGAPVVLQLAAGDPDGGTRSLLIERMPDRGHLVALRPAETRVTYVPPAGFVGQARFQFRLTDGQVVSEVHEAVIDVVAR